jgi:hypothetical protein
MEQGHALPLARVSISRKLVGTSTRTTNENDKRERATSNENGFRLRFSFWFFVFVEGSRFGFRWPPLADESAEQRIDPARACCRCDCSVGSAAARDGSDIECRRRFTDLTARDRIDPLLIRVPRPARSLRDIQAGAAGGIESLLTDPGIGNARLPHQRQQLPRSLICDELLVWKSRPVLHRRPPLNAAAEDDDEERTTIEAQRERSELQQTPTKTLQPQCQPQAGARLHPTKTKTKTINENEKPKRKPQTKTVLVARSGLAFGFR